MSELAISLDVERGLVTICRLGRYRYYRPSRASRARLARWANSHPVLVQLSGYGWFVLKQQTDPVMVLADNEGEWR